MSARARTLATCAAVALACARHPAENGPVLIAIAPAQGTAASPLPVEITGEHLDAQVRTDFASGGGEVAAVFAAALLPTAGGAAVPLEGVALTPQRTLRAIVPAGLARGIYDLSVTDPQGRTAVLERAFRVVTSAENVASFRVDVLGTPRAGIGFAVSLTAVDAQGRTVDGFDGSVTVTDLSATVSPASVGPLLLGRFQGQVAIAALWAGDRLGVTDAYGHAGTSEPFDVVAGPPVAVVFPAPPVSASVGACSPAVAVELRDGLAHPAVADAPIAARLQSAPPGLALFSDAACATPVSSVAFPAGAGGASFHFRAAAAGAVALRVVPSTLPSASQAATVSP